MQTTVEQCTSISCAKLQKTIRHTIDKTNPNASNEDVFQATLQQLAVYKINGQTFQFTHMQNQLGGYRWFFLCPSCNMRVTKLFLPPVSSGLPQIYLCKTCHKLKNQSSSMGYSRIYRRVTRPLKRLQKIEAKLKIGHLRKETIQALLDEYEKIEADMKNSTEYRLYVFMKKRGVKN